MTQDKELENLFATAITEFADNDRFMEQLSAKLSKVEYLKCVQHEQWRHYKMNLLLAFASGVLSTLTALILLPMLPSDIQIIESIIQLEVNICFPGNSKVLSALMIVALSYGFVFSLNSVRRLLANHRLATNYNLLDLP